MKGKVKMPLTAKTVCLSCKIVLRWNAFRQICIVGDCQNPNRNNGKPIKPFSYLVHYGKFYFYFWPVVPIFQLAQLQGVLNVTISRQLEVQCDCTSIVPVTTKNKKNTGQKSERAFAMAVLSSSRVTNRVGVERVT
jgi:hypothetical protein